MKIETLRNLLHAKTPLEFSGECCCCGNKATITAAIADVEITITGGAVFTPPTEWHCPDAYLLKCQDCWEKDPFFYPRTEVYSRVVGYIRPVEQWNKGKQAEFADRKEFKVKAKT